MDGDDWRWIWLGLTVAFAVGELAIPGTFFVLSFAVGAGIATIAAFLDGSTGLQWALFVGFSTLAILLLVPLGRRLAKSEGPEAQEGATRWVGRVAIVTEEIPASPHATGRVRVERDEWRAEFDGDDGIANGTRVKVVAVRGTRLVVAPLESNES